MTVHRRLGRAGLLLAAFLAVSSGAWVPVAGQSAAATTGGNLVCTAGQSGKGRTYATCTLTEPHGIRTVRVANTDPKPMSISFDCSSPRMSFKFNLPAGTARTVVVSDCSGPKGKTTYAIGADGSVIRPPSSTTSSTSTTFSTTSTTNPGQADLRTTVTNASATMRRADTLRTTFVVTNVGPDAAQNVVLRVTGHNPYRGYSIVGVSSDPFSCAAANGGDPFAHECSFGAVPAGDSRVAVFDYRADTSPDKIAPTGTVSSTTFDPNPTNNTGSDSTRILIQPDLVTTVSDGLDTVALGATMRMIVDVRNQPAPGYVPRDEAPSYEVRVEIPPQSRLDSYESPEGSCVRPPSEELLCSYGTLGLGSSRQLVLNLTAVQPGPAMLHATALLPDDTPDLRPENNSADDLTTVLA